MNDLKKDILSLIEKYNDSKDESIFMHCLPASRGNEVTNEIIDGKQSAVWLEALNRVHVQKSIIEWCLE